MARPERKGRVNKKRGKKGGKKDAPVEDAAMDIDQQEQQPAEQKPTNSAGIVFNDQHFQSAHFGEVDEEILGYFKNVEQTLDDPPFETGEGTQRDIYIF
jgi:nucleolar protein 9